VGAGGQQHRRAERGVDLRRQRARPPAAVADQLQVQPPSSRAPSAQEAGRVVVLRQHQVEGPEQPAGGAGP
jgi:hypothetical protein